MEAGQAKIFPEQERTTRPALGSDGFRQAEKHSTEKQEDSRGSRSHFLEAPDGFLFYLHNGEAAPRLEVK